MEISDEEVKSAYMQATDATEEMLEERGVELSTMRTEIQAALDALRDAWDGAGGDIVRYPGVRTEMLIGGGTSWGEDIEACTQINLFWESGMARVAGFDGKYTYPSCETELAKVMPFFMVPGTPGWHWKRKYPIPR
jgi:hypothetical protein